MLIADRLYGCGAFVWEVMPRLKEVGGGFLFRIRDSIVARKEIRRLNDGSQIIEVAAMLPGDYHKEAGRMQVR
ncbi:MAG: hypothetical protein FJ405_14285, partial [Verrucomicrobia bacterium]|nr:hypothetical protein [Verrucomicrobiota bacterium]